MCSALSGQRKSEIMSLAKWKLQTRLIRETLLLSHKFQKGHPCFLMCFSERSLGAAGSNPSSRLAQQFMSRGLYRCRLATI